MACGVGDDQCRRMSFQVSPDMTRLWVRVFARQEIRHSCKPGLEADAGCMKVVPDAQELTTRHSRYAVDDAENEKGHEEVTQPGPDVACYIHPRPRPLCVADLQCSRDR